MSSQKYHFGELAWRRIAVALCRHVVLFFNGLLYLAFNLFTGRLLRKFFPLTFKGLVADIQAALRGKLSPADPTHYTMVQRLAYLFVMMDSLLIVLSGLVLWKSVQFLCCAS